MIKLSNKAFFAILILLLLLVLILTLSATGEIALTEILQSPSPNHILGTDELGRDVMSRLFAGTKVSIFVGLSVLVLAGSVGISIGLISGWFGGWVDFVLMRITDIFLSFPGILIAITFAAIAGPGVENVILALGLMGWVSFARLTRVQVMSVKKLAFIQSAQISGVSLPIMWLKYIFPNLFAILVVESVFTIAGAMIAESGLSFLGIGIQPPNPSLGSMLREGARYMLVAPHLVFAPGVMLMLMVMSLNLFGEKLRQRLDKRSKIS